MTSQQPLRDIYREYLGGRITFEELKRASDRATELRLSRSGSGQVLDKRTSAATNE